MLDSDFHPEKISDSGKMYRKYKKKEYETLKKAYGAVWEDVRYFPVASREIFFENSWMAKDLMAATVFMKAAICSEKSLNPVIILLSV